MTDSRKVRKIVKKTLPDLLKVLTWKIFATFCVQFKLKARNIPTAIMEHRLEKTKSKRNRRRKTFYDEVSDIGVTVPVYFYADGFRTERDFAHFRMHRYVEERKLTEPQSSLDRGEILDLEEARQAEIVWAYYEREGNFWKA